MSQSNAYKKVEKPRGNQSGDIQKNEIRITAQGRSRSYISYAVGLLDPSLLQKDEGNVEAVVPNQQFDSVVLKAMGKAIQKAVTIAEVLKRRVAGLHQITTIESQEIEDQFEPKEEGMDIVTKKRTVSSIIITLSKKPLDTNALGYQPPIPEDQVTAPQIMSAKRVVVPGTTDAGKRRKRSNRGRGRGRGRGAAQGGVERTEKPERTELKQPAVERTERTERPERVRKPKEHVNAPVGESSTSAATGTTESNRGTSRTVRGGRGRGRGRGRGLGRGQPRKATSPTTQE